MPKRHQFILSSLDAETEGCHHQASYCAYEAWECQFVMAHCCLADYRAVTEVGRSYKHQQAFSQFFATGQVRAVFEQ